MFVFSVTVRVDDQRLLERGRSVRHSGRQGWRPVRNAIQHRHTVVGTQRQAVQRLGGCRRQEEQIRSVSAFFHPLSHLSKCFQSDLTTRNKFIIEIVVQKKLQYTIYCSSTLIVLYCFPISLDRRYDIKTISLQICQGVFVAWQEQERQAEDKSQEAHSQPSLRRASQGRLISF